MSKQLVGLSLLALLVAGVKTSPTEVGHRLPRQLSTVTRTTTSASTLLTTVTSTTSTVCVKYINATAACRKRRQFWIDTPIVLSLDEEMDPLAQQFLHPTPVASVQPTQLPYFKNGEYDSQPLNAVPIQPSVGLRPEMFNPFYFREGMGPFRPLRPYQPAFNYPYAMPPYGFAPEGRLGAVALVNLFAQVMGVAPTAFVTKTTTVSVTKTSMLTSTGTLVISGCSPPGIKYSTCSVQD